jgi:lysyl endopeptidase
LQIKVYPNPSTGRFNIDMAQSASYSVYNLSGVRLIEGKANGNFEINMSGFATGVYLLEIRNQEGIAVKRLLIK